MHSLGSSIHVSIDFIPAKPSAKRHYTTGNYSRGLPSRGSHQNSNHQHEISVSSFKENISLAFSVQQWQQKTFQRPTVFLLNQRKTATKNFTSFQDTQSQIAAPKPAKYMQTRSTLQLVRQAGSPKPHEKE
ncbi:hypothetical protein Nepgr_027262 [Nepenthes gracilis]|uniref:Uncharacterized protein n=1 Tax=Nepenthes gracilis TaxID=150966 RepID=A0AAD3TA07_NEPGR|nr:hypothetical protein Nepgr_027262 [Nepenthes gracilis]